MSLKFLWFLTVSLLLVRMEEARTCTSINIRNRVDYLDQLAGCTVVEGYVAIVLLERANETDFEPYSFPSLREVTQYLMFYRVRGLRSLGKLFPNLERIGGYTRFKGFALMVTEMFSLQEIGLKSLKEITRGSVIIFKNPNLCYVDTINWDKITQWDVVDNYKAMNHDPKECPRCQGCPEDLCWNAAQCQVKDHKGRDCHELCLGGCSEPGPRGCYSCRGVLHSSGDCAETCLPNTYKFLSRRCLTRKECLSTKWDTAAFLSEHHSCDSKYSTTNEAHYVIHEDQCLEMCPSGYEVSPEGTDCLPCRGGMCQNWCCGADIKSTEDARTLTGCTHINGSIEVSINTENSQIIYNELEKGLGSIQEIVGYLKIKRSSVTDLNFFKSLSTIQGIDYYHYLHYAFVVLDNNNMQEFWDWNVKRNLTIRGRLFFHHNPKLCLHRIYTLLDVIGHNKNVSSYDIGKASNGDKFPCSTTNIKVTVISKSFNAIKIHVPYIDLDYTTPELRYVLYYARDPHKNITMFDDLNQCSYNGWKTKDFSVNHNDAYFKAHGYHVNLTGLEPDTQYAFYVTTYTVSIIGARSDMNYEVTLPSKPGELTWLHASSDSNSEINLQWGSPIHSNGKLKEYIVTWSLLREGEPLVNNRDYCQYPMPMEYNTESEKNPIVSTPTKRIVNKTCCLDNEEPNHVKKEGFEHLCSNFKSRNFPIGLPDNIKFSSCQSLLYNYIYESPFKSNRENKRNKINVVNNPNLVNYEEYSKYNFKSVLNKQFHDKFNVKNLNVKKHVSYHAANSSGTIIKGLMNFQDYVVTVKACRQLDPQESNFSKDVRCSKAEIVTVRTLKDKTADIINSATIGSKAKGGTLTIWWKPPENTNGYIVAYEIEYRLRYEMNPNQIKECLTYAQFETNKRQYLITGLLAGKYEFRIRALSLSGQGPYTQFIEFDILDAKFSVIDVIFIILVEVVIIAMIIMLTLFLKGQPHKLDNIILAEVNPNYNYVSDSFEVNRNDVEFGRELGIGSFGKVYEGFLKPGNIRCAIKTVNDGASRENENEFLGEVTIMKSMTKAHHIVKLLGVVSRGRPPLVIMELMELGDLKTYLRSMRETDSLSYATMIKMAIEIADAMTFMEAQRFIHRDLAARNCMVSKDLTMKVGDFGMARDIYETDYYRKSSKGLLPIRWMAPESLQDGEFTSQSDIWSYGVVLWEIVTMAEQPYQGSSNDQVLHDVIAGRILEVPKQCPMPLRSIMSCCWKTKPSSRSSFLHILSSLEYYHDEEFKKVAYYYSREGASLKQLMWEYVEMSSVEDPLIGNKVTNPKRIMRTYSVLPSKGFLSARHDSSLKEHTV